MPTIDPEHEKQRLAKLYSQMIDGELLKTFSDITSLTDSAQEALQSEITKRGLTAPKVASGYGFELGDFTMVHRYRDLPEAMMAKGSLESAGVECFLADENMVRLDWFWSNLLGGVKLYVHSDEVDAAQEILGEPAPESFEVEGVGAYQKPRCPECGSVEIAFEELNKPVAYATAYFGVPIPLHHKGWRCHSCGHRWSDGSEVSNPEKT